MILIKNIEQLTCAQKCCKCNGKLFKSLDEPHKHEKKCTTETKIKFVGDKQPYYYVPETVFQKIEKLYKLATGKDDFFEHFGLTKNPYFIAYDFEALLLQINQVKNGLTMVRQHVPVSFSVNSNVPGYDTVEFECSRTPE